MSEGQPAGGASIDVPVIGRTKRVYVYGAAAVVAVIVGYAYYRRATVGGSATDEADYYADLRTGSDTGSDAYANPAPGGTGGSDAYDALPKNPTTDQEWTAAVVNTLSSYEPQYLYGVLGKYLSRQKIDAEEAAVVRSAWAAVGRPPGGQEILIAADTSSPGTSKAPGTPTGLRTDSLTGTSARIGWSPVAGAKAYHVYWGGGNVTTATGPSFTTGTLKPGTAYSFTVDAYNDFGTSAKSAVLTVKTPGTAPKAPAPAVKVPVKGTQPKPATKKPQVGRTLNRGDRGNDVKIVQKIVGVKQDGIFGPDTEAAVKRYQRAHGLTADGIVGPKTQAKMGI